jgi:Rieske Fe-S protein
VSIGNDQLARLIGSNNSRKRPCEFVSIVRINTRGGGPISKGPTRRDVISSAAGLAGLTLISDPALAAKKPESLPPQIGDRFQITKGPLKGELLRPGLLKVGEAPVIGFPFGPEGEILRKKNRLNRLLMIELDPANMEEETLERSAEGVLIYSAVCTHRGCTIASWKAEEQHFRCHCHLSEFDPLDNAKPLTGPAKKSLAAIPLSVDEEGFVVATGEFTRKPGAAKK